MSKRFKKVYVEITNVCNLSCSFCPKTARKALFMDVGTAERVLDQLVAYTDYVYFHLMGEPLLHPLLPTLLELCAQKGLKVNLTTNGTLISTARDTLLAASALRKVGFSLHSFEANRIGCSPEAYLTEVLSFAEDAARAGVICELRLWNGDSVTRSGENEQNGEILRQIEQWCGKPIGGELSHGSIKLREKVYLGFAEIFDWPKADDANENPGDAFCYGLRDQIGVLADGTVVPCCLDSEGTIALGNILDTPLAKLLDTPRAAAIYNGFSRRTAVEPLCKSCGYARRFTGSKGKQ